MINCGNCFHDPVCKHDKYPKTCSFYSQVRFPNNTPPPEPDPNGCKEACDEEVCKKGVDPLDDDIFGLIGGSGMY